MVDKEDDRIKSSKTWIKWNQLNNGTSMKYRNKMFIKSDQREELNIVLEQNIKHYNVEKCKKSENEAPKRA